MIREDRRQCRYRLLDASGKMRGRFVLSDHAKEHWRALAEAARRVAELMQDQIGRQTMLDTADACEQLADNPRLAKVTRIWPQPDSLDATSLNED
jgi:hypothetical protein